MQEGAAIKDYNAEGYGGAVLVGNGTADPIFNMEGGSITRNKTTTTQNKLDYGDNVYISGGTMNMIGDSITSNSVTLDGGVLLYSGAFNLSGDSVITGNTTELDTISSGQSNVSLHDNMKITIPASKNMGENAQVGVYTVVTPTQGNDVQFTTGGSEADKTHFTSDNATQVGVVFNNNVLWLSVDARAAATSSVNAATGEGFVTFDGNSSFKYAVRIPDTPPTIPEGVKAYGTNGAEITVDDKGWFQPSTTGKITFKHLPVGLALELVSVGGSDSDTTPVNAANKTDATVPAVSLDQLSAQVVSGKVAFTIDRATTGYSYALVDASNNVVKFNNEGAVDSNGSVTWTPEANGKVTFKGLEPNAKYTVVAAKTGDDMPDKAAIKTLANNKKVAVDFITPSASLKDVKPGNVTAAVVPGTPETATVTVQPTEPNQQYAVIDPEIGKIVAPVTVTDGSDNNGDGWVDVTNANNSLTFTGLNPNKEYQIVTREKPSDSDTEPGIPGSGVTVSAAKSLPNVEKLTGGAQKGQNSSDDDTAYMEFPTESGKKYYVVDGNGSVVAGTPVTGDVNLAKVSGLTPGKDYRIIPVNVNDSAVTDGNVANRVGTEFVAPVVPVSPENVSWNTDGANDTITISNPVSGQEYPIIDPTSGVV